MTLEWPLANPSTVKSYASIHLNENVNVNCLPTEHQEFSRSHSKCLCIPGSNWNLEMLGFEERGKPEYLEKNLSEQSIPNNKLNPHMTPGLGVKPRPHWPYNN